VLAAIPSATLHGIDGIPVRVEVHVGMGLPGLTIVGLPDAACRESRDRVRAAIVSSGIEFPMRKVTVNLAPSGIPKGGAGLDLPIAIGLLVANGVLDPGLVNDCGFIGELGLNGSVRRVPGILSLVEAQRAGVVIVPSASGAEALLARRAVRAVASLRQLVDCLRGDTAWAPIGAARPAAAPGGPDLADVRGQVFGRWAAEVAAAGGHNLLMVGPPGAGKTMLAERLPGLLPPLTDQEALETTRIYSAASRAESVDGLIRRPPFRSPHHSSSAVALIGGGSRRLSPGEISLATNGVLFLDELTEFPTAVLDGLRQPLEEGTVMVCRSGVTARFPARFLLVAAMNPCRCGSGTVPGRCRCLATTRERYARRVSGPLVDRFDLRVMIDTPGVTELMGVEPGEPTAPVACRVARARLRAAERGVVCNSRIPVSRLDELAPLDPLAADLLQRRLEDGTLNPRGLHRVRRVALTVADLSEHEGPLPEEYVAAALHMRPEYPSLLQVDG
jgi:magnesium chelatase family protein